jgi:hypothetical protein
MLVCEKLRLILTRMIGRFTCLNRVEVAWSSELDEMVVALRGLSCFGILDCDMLEGL